MIRSNFKDVLKSLYINYYIFFKFIESHYFFNEIEERQNRNKVSSLFDVSVLKKILSNQTRSTKKVIVFDFFIFQILM